ncbi:MAG: hypothetical protein Q8L38_05105, partial [Pseudohongiella sp.]|nr:hypothetical protein [Pseudohongiella sp.]
MSVDLSIAVKDNPNIHVSHPGWADHSLCDTLAFDQKLGSGMPTVTLFKDVLAQTQQELDRRYRA